MKPTRTIRWVLYHEPIHLFIRTAKVFSEEIQKLTDGRINVEVYTMAEYSEKFKDSVKYEPLALIQSGEIEMTQMQTSIIAVWNSSDFFALEMPYLFRDHDHATRVLDGEIGRGLLDSLQDKTPVHGLAFTYSGGYRVLATDREVLTTEDLDGLKVITSANPVMVETAKSFGCEPMPYMIRDFAGKAEVLANEGHSIETTLPRYEYEANPNIQKYIADTQHSMYLTSILISKEFWNSLDVEDQAHVRAAAASAAVQEREWSVKEAEEYATNTARHEELGVTYKKFSEEELDKMKKVVVPLYDKYSQLFTPGLIDGIIKA
jgi:TRAP-type transport system periplasmic protein